MMIVFPDTQILYYMYFILYFNVTNESTLKLSSVLVLLLPHNVLLFFLNFSGSQCFFELHHCYLVAPLWTNTFAIEGLS